MDAPTLRVRTAHADAWQVVGLARPEGRTGDVRGARLMSSGIADPRWNNADVTSPDPDVAAMKAWYREQDVPWGVRVPVEWTAEVGTPLFTKRVFGLLPSGAGRSDDTDLHVGRCDDLDAFVAAEVAAFGDDPGLIRSWIEPTFEHPSFGYWIAEEDGSIAAIATTIASDGEAGPATMITGVSRADLRKSEADQRVEICNSILDAAPEGTLIHAYAATDDEASLWLGLGFVEVSGFTVRVVRDR